MAIWKDEGLEHLDNSKDIFEILQINSFYNRKYSRM
jgi:hypothetical protein